MTPAGRAAASWLGGTALALAVVGGLGALPTARLGGPGGWTAMAAGCAVAFAGAALGAAPVLLALARGPIERPQTVAARSMALRAAGALTGTLVVALGTGVARLPFLIWVGVAYGALLVVETRWLVRWIHAGGTR